ncbi:MAG: gliding motility-associated C-terminal domain-containing protein [bacterium]|nr:gliding motility-associated C-terminal domain-containing protein [bacterium]
MRRLKITYLAFQFVISFTNAQTFHVEENASIFIQDNATIQFGGALDNYGFIENNGEIGLFGNFNNLNIFNGSEGILSLLGGADQVVFSPILELQSLMVNSDGQTAFNSDSIVISQTLDFQNGIVKVGDSTSFVVLDGVDVTGGNDFSYLDGSMIQFGTGYKYYPIGDSIFFDPIEFLNITGVNLRMKLFVTHPPTSPLVPAPDEVIGVSEHAIWTAEVEEGVFDSSLVTLDFMNADLENFTRRNDIQYLVKSPVVVYTDSIGDVYRSLGVSELLESDSVSTGIITSEMGVTIGRTNIASIGLGLAPLIPTEGVVHVPNAFSPAATEIENQTYRIFGEKILEEGFELKIFNRFNVVVYETTSWREANTSGWDGTNPNSGNPEPGGLYYYTLKLRRENGEEFNDQGVLYLIR